MQQRLTARVFTGMTPRKGAHLCIFNPETGVLEPFELVNCAPNRLPVVQGRKGLVPILTTANTTFPLKADNDSTI